MRVDNLLKNIGAQLEQIFDETKVREDFLNCLKFFNEHHPDSLIKVSTNDGKEITFPKDAETHIFSIVYQTNVVEGSESIHIRVCMTIGKMFPSYGVVNAEFGYAVLYYNEQAECYSNDFLYSIYS